MNRLVPLIMLAMLSLPVNANEWIYSFRPGDTLWQLCQRYVATPNCWQKIAKRNEIKNPKNIKPGTRIYLPVSWLNVVPAVAKVLIVEGDVRLLRHAQDAPPGQEQPRPLTKAAKISVGDQIITQQGMVTLEFADQSILVISKNSVVDFDTLSVFGDTGMVDTRIRLNRGRAKAKVKPRTGEASRYEIVTPAAVAAVRGTEFRVTAEQADPPIMRTEVLQGTVWVNNDSDQKTVSAGYALSAIAGQKISEPTQLLTAPVVTSNLSAAIKQFPWALSWQAVPGASAYRLKVYKKGLIFNSLKLDQRVLGSRYPVEKLPKGLYVAELSAIDTQNFEGKESSYDFEVAEPPKQYPISISKNASQLESDGTILWRWTASEGASSYKVLVKATLADETVEEKTFTVIKNEFVQKVSAPGVYELRVAPVVNGKQLTYTEPETVEVPAEGVAPLWVKLLTSAVFLIFLL